MRIESIRDGASGTAIVAAGGSSFLVDLAQLEALGLEASSLAPAKELDEAAEALLRLAAEALEAEKRGLSLLARAEQSTFMLRAKLESRDFSKGAVRLALERLKAQGWLDDGRFARAYAASRLARRAEGPSTLSAALRARGIDSETAATAVSGLLDPETRKAALEKAYEKELKRARGDEAAAKAKLRTLGFRPGEISEFFAERED